MAPKAYLGNYKIYGSPQANDSTTDDVIVQALEDAFNDGMDIVSFSSGGRPLRVRWTPRRLWQRHRRALRLLRRLSRPPLNKD